MEQGHPPSAALQLRALGGVHRRAHGVSERVVCGGATLVDGVGGAGAAAAVQLPAAGEVHGVIADRHKAAGGIASHVPAFERSGRGHVGREVTGDSGVERVEASERARLRCLLCRESGSAARWIQRDRKPRSWGPPSSLLSRKATRVSSRLSVQEVDPVGIHGQGGVGVG